MSSAAKTPSLLLPQWVTGEKPERTDFNAAFLAIDQGINFASPVGEMKIWSTETAPAKHLICNGALVSRTTYADLFAVIGTLWGAGDGSTTFAIPNLKGRVPVGVDGAQTEFNLIGKTYGAKTHVLDVTQIPAHRHSIGLADVSGPNGYMGIKGSGYGDDGIHTYGAESFAGGGLAHNNIQPSVTVNYIIRAMA